MEALTQTEYLMESIHHVYVFSALRRLCFDQAPLDTVQLCHYFIIIRLHDFNLNPTQEPSTARQVHFLMRLRITSVHVGAFTREDGQAAPHSKFGDHLRFPGTRQASWIYSCFYIQETPLGDESDHILRRALQGSSYAEPGTGDDFMQLPVAVDHQFICFPSSVGRNSDGMAATRPPSQ